MSTPTPIAIIGLSGQFPGKATDPLNIWEMCAKGHDAWSEIPSTRFNAEGYYHPDQSRSGASNIKGGFFLLRDLARFDASFFGMTKTEAASLDPQQRLLLESTYEALENAGISMDRVSCSDTGVFVGSFCFDWAKITLRDPDALPLYHATGSGQAMLANRVSYFFNMRGPSITIDTACSSSLVALHQACQALRAGECSMAVVAGVNCLLCHDSLGSMNTMGFLSVEGRSFTYDKRAAGYGRGEGVGVVVLKRLEQALQEGDAVRAVIRNTGVNQDGRTPGITFPSGAAQAALIQQVYAQAGLDLADTSYVEVHGTGTQVGDPIEAEAIHDTFGVARTSGRDMGPLVLGCIKTNIGHLEGAAGVAGLIKTVLMLEREMILPNADFQMANEAIPLSQWKLEVPTELRDWRKMAEVDGLSILRASINGFGYGGTNAHVIVENVTDYLRSQNTGDEKHSTWSSGTSETASGGDAVTEVTRTTLSPTQEPGDGYLVVPLLFVLTASDKVAGAEQGRRLAEYVAGTAGSSTDTEFLEDLANTLATRRSVLSWKAAVTAASSSALQEALATVRHQPTSATRKVRVGWVFTGQGAQWWGMGRELAQTSAAFRASLDRSTAMLASSTLRADWSLETELLAPSSAATSRVHEPAVSQPLCTVLQVALVDMLRAWGLQPTAVVGHSSGEIGAAYAAGLLSHEAAVAAAYFRVPLDSEAAQACRGGMVVLACSEAETLALLDDLRCGSRASIACYNSPQSFTVSGDDAAVDELVALCVERDIRHRRLPIAFAYHSHRMDAAAADYRRLLHANRTIIEAFGTDPDTDCHLEAVQMFSSVTGHRLQPDALTLDYWVDNLVSPVRFMEALTTLCYQAGQKTDDMAISPSSKPAVDVLVEIGPHTALAGPMRQILQADPVLTNAVGVLGVLRRDQNATETALALAAALFARGATIDIHAVNEDARNSPAGTSAGNPLRVPQLLTDLPAYPWNHETAYWAEPRESRRYRQRAHGRHDLLGAPVRFGNPLEPRWRQWIRISETPWVRDHRVQGQVVYPAAGYLCMAIEAARQTSEESNRLDRSKITGYELRDVALGKALVIPDDSGEVEVHISLRAVADNAQDSSTVWHEFFVHSCSSSAAGIDSPMGTPVVDTWSEHCRGQIAVRWAEAEAKARADSGETVTDITALRQERVRLDAARRIEVAGLCTRDVDVAKLYAHCTRIGLQYGPTFANLAAARAGQSETDSSRRITGTVTVPDVTASMPTHFHSPVVVHPGTLDACLHGIMAFEDLLQAAIMPVYFGRMFVSAELEQTRAGDRLSIFLNVRRSGFRNLHVDLAGYAQTALNDPLIRMEDLRMTSLAGNMDGSNNLPPKTYFGVAWQPDPALLTTQQFTVMCSHLMPSPEENLLLRRLDQSSFYMADGALAQIPEECLPTLSSKGRKLYQSLVRQRDSVLRVQAEEAASTLGGLEAVKKRPVCAGDIASWPNATVEQRAAELADLRTTTMAEGPLLAAVSASMHRIVLGDADPLEVTMQDDVLGRYYALNPRMARQYQQAAVYVRLLAHKNPQIRILEIGAGTGGATLPLLEALGRPDQPHSGAVPRFSSYDVTDISSGFFEAVRDKTRVWLPRLHFRRLDIEQDPSGQGFSTGSYDLVVAANVLHATRNIAKTVSHARQLLRPGGTLLLIELVIVPEQRVATAAVANLFGIFDGWWMAEEAHRQNSPLLSESQWDAVLRENSFSGLDIAVWETDDIATHQGSMMLSTAVNSPDSVLTSSGAPILVTDGATDILWLRKLALALSPSTPCPVYSIDQDFPLSSQTLIFYQTNCDTLGPQTSESMEHIRRLFVRPPDSSAAHIMWLTRGTTTGAGLPDFSLAIGLLRTLRVELGGRLVHLDLSPSSDDVELVCRTFSRSFCSGSPELELAVHDNGIVHLPRYIERPSTCDYVAARTGRRHVVNAPAIQPGRALYLEVSQPGQLDSLFFDDDARHKCPLPGDQVEIQVHAAGLNFHDVMVAMGQVQNRSLGIECAGVVTHVGSHVTNLRLGDRVAAPASGTFATTARIAAQMAQIVPDDMSLTVAAGLPIVLCTAVHALRVAAIATGETVLIHSAAGGLGQVLVQLCQQRGATVYATAGSVAKKRFLVEHCGLSAQHVFSSRDESFVEALLQATSGCGVDVVFNVLAGELLHASWRCMASFGRFIELGKRDLQRHGRLDMAPFARNITFAAIDLITLLSGHPDYGARLWANSMDLVRQGIVRPPTPLTVFPLGDAVSALRTMQAGRHMGKIVLVMDATKQTEKTTLSRVMSPQIPPVCLRPDATYLLVGGLGGIGRALAARMVHDLGARHLLLLSRGGITSNVAATAVADLRAAGARILVSNGDVGDATQLSAALQAVVDENFPPIRGAVHLGLVMESALFQKMTSDAWNNSLRPKVAGTWNLHRQLPDDLDFFVLVSSMVGIIGNPSQSAYGAASVFQDAFACFRRHRGLAATTIDLGMVSSIGYVADHASIHQTLQSHGFESVEGNECLALIESALFTASSSSSSNILSGLGIGRFTGGDVHRPSFFDPRFCQAVHLAQAAVGNVSSDIGSRASITASAATQSIRARIRTSGVPLDILAQLERALHTKIGSLLMLPSADELDLHIPISQQGLDSLIAVELRNWVMSEMEVTVPVLEFLGSHTVKSLAHFIKERLVA